MDLSLDVDYRELGRVADAHSRQVVLLRSATRRAVKNAAVGLLREAGEGGPVQRSPSSEALRLRRARQAARTYRVIRRVSALARRTAA